MGPPEHQDRAGKRQLLCTYFVLVPQAMEGNWPQTKLLPGELTY